MIGNHCAPPRSDVSGSSRERYLKTDNVLVAHDGRVVITDFGIARAIKAADADAPAENTAMTALIGTPAYMAPEQVRGHAKIDTRADLYGLGVMLFQMFTGRLPFVGNTAMEMALARLYEAPRDPLTLRPDLPRELVEFLRHSLECNPEGRFQTAAAMASALVAARPSGPDLEEFLRSRSVASRRAGVPAGLHSLDRQLRDHISFAATFLAQEDSRSAAPTTMLAPSLTPRSRQLAVTVLMLRLTGSKAEEYLAHGLTEEIIDRLSEAEGLLVTSFGVVRELPVDQREPSVLQERLKAQVIVDGTLRVLASGLSATVRIIEVERGLQLAVRRFERPDRNVLALALEIAKVIGGLLTVRVEQSQGGIVNDPVAVDLYMRGRHEYHSMSAHAAAQSVELFERALARLPDESTLLIGYALALARHWFFAGEGAASRAIAAAERAVRAAPEQGEAYLALATVQINANRLVEAAASLRWALARAPRLAEAHELLGHLLTETGPMDLALRHLNYALMLDRAVPRVRFSLARAYALTGQLEAAFQQVRWEGLGAEFGFIRWVVLARFLCWSADPQRIHAVLADPALAEPALQRPRELIEFLAGRRMMTPEEFVPPGYLSQSVSPRGRVFGLQLIVEYHCFLRQYEEALHGLRQLSRLSLVDIQWLDHCPVLAPLRAAPDFPEIRAPILELTQNVQRALGILTD